MTTAPTTTTTTGILLAFCLALGAGCGGSTSASSIGAACADVAAARCNQASECSLPDSETGTGFNILESYGSKATCISRQTLNCTNALNAPQNGNNPTQVGMCVVALVGTSCTEFFDNDPPAACTPAGPRPAGAPCTFNAECASAHCNGTKTSICGACGDAPTADADCADSTCTNGDRCVAATTTCQPIVASGGSCDSGHPCDRGFSCLGEDAKTGTSGTCTPAATTVGAACGGTMPGCDGTRGLACSGPNGAKICRRVIYPGYNGTVSADGGATAADGGGSDANAAPTTPAGTACGQLADGSRAGCVAGACYTATGPATGSDQGTCKPFANDGDPCDTAVGPGCMFPARCVVAGAGDGGTAGTCVIPVATICPWP